MILIIVVGAQHHEKICELTTAIALATSR